MALNFNLEKLATPLIVGVVVGGVDEYLEREELTTPPAHPNSLSTKKNIGRIAGTALGLAAQVFMPGKYDHYAQLLTAASSTLLTKSVSKVAMPIVPQTAAGNYTRTGSYERVSRTYEPEFSNVGIL